VTKARGVGVRYSCTLSLTSALDWGGWSLHALVALPPGHTTGIYCTGGGVGHESGLGGRGKSRPHRDLTPNRPTRSESICRPLPPCAECENGVRRIWYTTSKTDVRSATIQTKHINVLDSKVITWNTCPSPASLKSATIGRTSGALGSSVTFRKVRGIQVLFMLHWSIRQSIKSLSFYFYYGCIV